MSCDAGTLMRAAAANGYYGLDERDLKIAMLQLLCSGASALPVPTIQVIGASSDQLSWAAAGITPATWTVQESVSANGPWTDFVSHATGNTVGGIDSAMFYRVTGYNAAGVAVTSVSNVVFAP